MVNIKSEPIENYIQKFYDVVILFGSPRCSACSRVVNEIIPLLEYKYPQIEFMFLDGDKFSKTSDLFDIEYYPTLIRFINGEVYKKVQTGDIERIESIIK
jgi:thioredoxin-like negative regulator of GroEL